MRPGPGHAAFARARRRLEEHIAELGAAQA